MAEGEKQDAENVKSGDGTGFPNHENGEQETDSFEDAMDSTDQDQNHTSSPQTSTRSLTNPKTLSLSTSGGDQEPATDDTNLTHEDHAKANGPVHDTTQPKSPLLTSHRLSTISLDNVNLGEDSDSHAVIPKDSEKKLPLPSKAPVKSALMGLSGALPSVPWGAPPPLPTSSKALPPVQPSRKLTSPFSWLSRNASTGKENVTSPPLPPVTDRRNTASSIATLSSNPELMLNKLEETSETDNSTGGRNSGRNSLRDRFKLLRMREEAGIVSLEDESQSGSAIAGLIGRSATLGLGIASPVTIDENSSASPLATSPSSHGIGNVLSSTKTAHAAAGSPSMGEFAAQVDWDLWQAVVYEGPAAVVRTSPEELSKAIASGIPNAIRGVVWQVLAQSKNEELESVYGDLIARGTDRDKESMSASSGAAGSSAGTNNGSSIGNIRERDIGASSASSIHSDQSTLATTATNGVRSSSPSHDPDFIAKIQAVALAEKKRKAKEDAASLLKLEKAIKRDLGARTSFSKFTASAGLQDGLFGVCKAYALFDEGVGYAQGMNFLAMPLLFNMPEEEAFCLLVRLMNQYHLRDLFIQDMPGLHMHLYQFERLLEDFEPALYCHLHRRHVTPHLYATQWFLTLFAYRFPLQLVLRIYDLILSEGLEAILKFGIVLMQKNAATLLEMNDMVALTNFLKDKLFDVYIDQAPSAGSILESGFFGSSGASIDKEVYRADVLVQDACAVKITPELLKTYATEWEDKTRAEAAREAELESLKANTTSLSQKVYQLEKRVEEHDTEHAALATELVRTKVENEELRDENESLKGQVRELRKVVEKQPGEVEDRLKVEMDRLMKRNQEVHEENSKLEEEMGEMEQSLVKTKMEYAEINSQHEALMRKWTDLRKALD